MQLWETYGCPCIIIFQAYGVIKKNNKTRQSCYNTYITLYNSNTLFCHDVVVTIAFTEQILRTVSSTKINIASAVNLLKYWGTSTPYHTCPNTGTSPFDNQLICLITTP